MKKLIFLFAILPFWTVNAFNDVSEADPQYEIFKHLNEVGVMTSYGDGNFYPEKIITRAEAIAIALRAGQKIPSGEYGGGVTFSDVDPNEWYAPFIYHAANIGAISKKGGAFRPNEAVSKAEFLAFLFRLTRVNFDKYYTRTKNIAKDIPADAWYAPHFAHAKKYQIANLPVDGFYKPNETLTRRRAAMMTYRQLKIFHGDEVSKDFVELNAQISQFLNLLKSGQHEDAELYLQRILELTDSLALTKNDQDAVAMDAISKSMKHFSKSLRAFKFNQNLTAIEQLNLADKQARRASEKSESVAEFSRELIILIDDTLNHFIMESDF